MEYIDVIIAIPLLWGAIIGFKKGLIIELASLVALFLGIYGSIQFSEFTSVQLSNHLEINPQWLGLLSFLVTFLAIVISVFLLAKILDKFVKAIALGMVNRIAGMLFGICKYALILSFLFYFFNQFNSKFHFIEEDWKTSSLLYKPIYAISMVFKNSLEFFTNESDLINPV